MLNGLDLFSGIGGFALALKERIIPLAYCELDSYCQGVLLSRMADQAIHQAPIWDDIRTFEPGLFGGGCVDIITAGFPCQDISVAGNGAGLAGERSGLFFEIMRLAKEIKPRFIFLENTKGILSNGGREVVDSLMSLGYSCRWITKSCREVGSPQNRERWFCLAYAKHFGSLNAETMESFKEAVRNDKEGQKETGQLKGGDSQGVLSSSSGIRPQNYWDSEPPICRVVDGIPFRMERIKSMANSVCPQQTKEAFKELMGIK